MARLTFLGTGTSTGIPFLGCRCPVCASKDPRDRRLRASVLVEEGESVLVIDATPEFRLQCLAAGVERLDALFLTHDHADHIAGLDDVRAFTLRSGRPLPVYANAGTLAKVRTRFDYIWGPPYIGGNLPEIDLVEMTGPVTVGALMVEPVPVWHGPLPILGYRIGSLAYVTDVSAIPPASEERLRGLDVLILDALRLDPHPTHFSLDEALATVERLSPRQAWFTHMCHHLSHARDSALLPAGVAFAHDGLTVEFES